MKKPKKPKIEHYLITLDLAPQPAHIHAYVMTNDEASLDRVINRMIVEAEKNYGPVTLPIFLSTKLGDATEAVRNELCARLEDCAKTMAAATDFHLTMWIMHNDDPWTDELMALH
jgi:hypothetical protein